MGIGPNNCIVLDFKEVIGGKVKSRVLDDVCFYRMKWAWSYRADDLLCLLSGFPEGQLDQQPHGRRQLALHHQLGAGPADVGGAEELPRRLTVRLDHGFQGSPLNRVLHRRHVHAEVGLRRAGKQQAVTNTEPRPQW